ncbi:hypothetical protein HMPREF1554_00622 [Porphyromonas gingivalis F0569]|nr:hypothetical protein HMPREF1554_00622 [Porphyromonas gingivalis F0569]
MWKVFQIFDPWLMKVGENKNRKVILGHGSQPEREEREGGSILGY